MKWIPRSLALWIEIEAGIVYLRVSTPAFLLIFALILILRT